jgi:GTP-binding protein
MKIRSVEFVGTVVDPKAPFPADLPQVAFSGRSNVGKSSLINTLVGRTKSKVARESATPGKTQALNFYRVNDAFLLVDLPGFGFAKAPAEVRQAWRPLVEGYLARRDGPRAVVHLMDVRRDPTDDDLQMLDYLSGLGIPTLVGITKVDKLTRERRGKVVLALTKALALDPGQIVPLSSKTGEGKEDLLGAIQRIVEEPEPAKPQRSPHG